MKGHMSSRGEYRVTHTDRTLHYRRRSLYGDVILREKTEFSSFKEFKRITGKGCECFELSAN